MRLFGVIFALFALLAHSVRGQNLITNGTFGEPGLGSITSVPFGTTTPTGWTYTIGNASGADDYYAQYGQTTNDWIPWAPTGAGTYSVQIDSASATVQGTPGSISQTVNNLQAGAYQLTFSMSGEANMPNDGLHPLTSSLELLVVGQTSGLTYLSGTYSNTQSAYGLSQAATVWSTYTVTFTTTQTENLEITFEDVAASESNNFSLANVSLVPEFSHWAAFAGFGLVCALIETRRRRRAF